MKHIIRMSSGAEYIVSAEDASRIEQAMIGSAGAFAQHVTTESGVRVFVAIVNVESVTHEAEPAEEAVAIATAAAANGVMPITP
jgi:hypothetical protein